MRLRAIYSRCGDDYFPSAAPRFVSNRMKNNSVREVHLCLPLCAVHRQYGEEVGGGWGGGWLGRETLLKSHKASLSLGAQAPFFPSCLTARLHDFADPTGQRDSTHKWPSVTAQRVEYSQLTSRTIHNLINLCARKKSFSALFSYGWHGPAVHVLKINSPQID